MDNTTGEILFVLLAAVALSCVGAWVLAWRYRRVMQRLMRAPLPGGRPDPPSPPVEPAPLPRPPAPVTLADNRRAGLRLTLLLIGLSAVMAATSAALQLGLSFGESMASLKRLAVFVPVHLWPAIPAIGLLWRWSFAQALAALAAWAALCFALMLWRSIEPRPLELLLFLGIESVAPVLLVAGLFLGNAVRAGAPWLLLPMVGLVAASMAGIGLLGVLVERRSPVLMAMPDWLGAHAAMALFALLPWLLAWWPLRALGRSLGRAYARKRVSELVALFTVVWAVALLLQALTAASSIGIRGALLMLPLLWIPVAMRVARPGADPRGRPPTLLVLRVFQRDAQVQALFDDVIERWRLTGSTVLIAGTDLADRTLDAEDIFTFLDGGLARRFIQQPADVGPRLDAFDLQPDADGRHRINECYCHDSTWRHALDALVRRADVVLMDLRGFQAHNAGCLHELGTLAAAGPALARVVVLTDAGTDRATADAAVRGAPAGRFEWLQAPRIDRRGRRDVLASLFVASGSGAS